MNSKLEFLSFEVCSKYRFTFFVLEINGNHLNNLKLQKYLEFFKINFDFDKTKLKFKIKIENKIANY